MTDAIPGFHRPRQHWISSPLITAPLGCPTELAVRATVPEPAPVSADTSTLPLAPIDGFCDRPGAVRWRTCFSDAKSAGSDFGNLCETVLAWLDSTACAFGLYAVAGTTALLLGVVEQHRGGATDRPAADTATPDRRNFVTSTWIWGGESATHALFLPTAYGLQAAIRPPTRPDLTNATAEECQHPANVLRRAPSQVRWHRPLGIALTTAPVCQPETVADVWFAAGGRLLVMAAG